MGCIMNSLTIRNRYDFPLPEVSINLDGGMDTSAIQGFLLLDVQKSIKYLIELHSNLRMILEDNLLEYESFGNAYSIKIDKKEVHLINEYKDEEFIINTKDFDIIIQSYIDFLNLGEEIERSW